MPVPMRVPCRAEPAATAHPLHVLGVQRVVRRRDVQHGQAFRLRRGRGVQQHRGRRRLDLLRGRGREQGKGRLDQVPEGP